MLFEVVKDKTQDAWLVEAINYEGGFGGDKGEIFAASFSGRMAEERAEEYANWKNNQKPQRFLAYSDG